jgi:hypothetical protein
MSRKGREIWGTHDLFGAANSRFLIGLTPDSK